MTISARTVADSIGPNGIRLTTFVLRYPRFVHAEFMTHRAFSKNAASSRAIPIAKMIQGILKDPAMPVFWGKNQAGMQAGEALTGWRLWLVQQVWLKARYLAIAVVWLLMKLKLHKQISNRLLEPWMHIEVIMTATDFANFYALRDHPAAQPEMQALAKAMLEAHNASTPKVLEAMEWHIPFIRESDEHLDLETKLKVSAARCARISYLKHDGTTSTLEEDLATYQKLMGGVPMHASPTEHQARAELRTTQLLPEQLRSNLRGWVQYRKTIDNNTVWSYKGFER